MAKRNGTYLKILSDGVTISNLTDVTMDIDGATIDVTTKDSSGWKEILPGLKSAKMSGTALVDNSSTLPPYTILSKLTGGTSCAVIFSDITTGQKSYTATGYYTKFSQKGGVEDAQRNLFPDTATEHKSVPLISAEDLQHPQLAGVRSVELVCQPELVPFYRRHGFTDQVGHSRLMRRSADLNLIS